MAARYERTAAIDRVADLDADLRELLGVAPDTPLELVSPQVSLDALEPLERYLTRAESANPELRTALTRVEQAQHAVRLARADFIPDVGLFVSHTYQDALALLPDQNSVVGVRLQWTLLDFGKRSSAVAERFATLRAARVAREQALAHTRAGVEKAYRRAARAESAAQAAIAALDARTLAERDVQAAYRNGLQVAASQALGTATRMEAEVRALEALLALRIARAELARAIGETG
jgi:outer membrane protein TolC